MLVDINNIKKKMKNNIIIIYKYDNSEIPKTPTGEDFFTLYPLNSEELMVIPLKNEEIDIIKTVVIPQLVGKFTKDGVVYQGLLN